MHQGLSKHEILKQRKVWGPNIIADSHLKNRMAEILSILSDPMGLMLLGLGALYWVLGDISDAIIIFIAYIPVTAIDAFLEVRSTRALRALKNLFASTVKVIRDGDLQEISTFELVPDDIICFEEGQALPADGLILEATSLIVNEAPLTGESIPVVKQAQDKFWSGTTTISGTGVGIISKTGKHTQLGKIAQSLDLTAATKSPLQIMVDQLVKKVVFVAIGLALFLFFIEWMNSHKLIPSIIVGLTFGVAAIPEEFPLVFTLFLSLGAWRLSKWGILVKSLPSVETLGAVDVICTDKTGTLTEGQFQLVDFKLIDPAFNALLAWKTALMSCEINPVDSLESAIFAKNYSSSSEPVDLNTQAPLANRNLLAEWTLINDYPFETRGKHMSHVWQRASKDNPLMTEKLIAMKGAVEGVLEHCRLTPEQNLLITNLAEQEAARGKRILGLAFRSGVFTGERSEDEGDLTFVGLLIFSDPVRKSVAEAIQKCQAAGIQIKMLTGDHLLTAHAVADQIGIIHQHDSFFSGQQLEQMDLKQKTQAYLHGTLFARMQPDQKLEMIQTLQKNKNVVAMTGDGINDASALKLADIGISMGKSATDVARSSAKMVLLNNDFSGIIGAVLEGRQIFANLKRSFSYLVGFHIPLILLAFIPSILKWPVFLMPIHIILLELVVHPISAFTFENIIDKHLKKNETKKILQRSQFLASVASGLLLSFISLSVFKYFMPENIDKARTLGLVTVLMGNIFLVLVESLPQLRFRFYLTTILLILTSLGLTQNSQISSFFHFTQLSIIELTWIIGLSSLTAIPRLSNTLINNIGLQTNPPS